MGKLNLLHHKSWHVYSEKNREKVRKDEKEFDLKQAKLKKKELKIVQEENLKRLREAAHGPSATDREGHVRLFEEEELLEKSKILPTEKELDAKKFQDRYTMYLGETKEGKKDDVWYASLDYGKGKKLASTTDLERKKKERKDLERKDRLDPSRLMKDYMASKQDGSSQFTKYDQYKKSSSSSSLPSGGKSLDQLRQERIEREKKEKSRTMALLNPGAGAEDHNQGDRTFYNSQFNRDHVRKR